jgi:pyruvate dehydrogenase E1 component alpha subunit
MAAQRARTGKELLGLDHTTLRRLYRMMTRIRTFEERLREEFWAGRVPGYVHLSIGQEAVAAGACAHLGDADAMISTHRPHGHCIAKGADLPMLAAELCGRASGLCGGKGGSMHLAQPQRGIFGANGIVGAGLPQACGIALKVQYLSEPNVVACFFGDGAVDEGAFHESLNLAALWCLPVVFVCENNLYADTMPVKSHIAGESIAARASAYGLPGETVDGMDVFSVYKAAAAATARARAGQGATLLECRTYRFYGHAEGAYGLHPGDHDQRYRTREEVARHVGRDPLMLFRTAIRNKGLVDDEALDGLDAEARTAVDEAFASAFAAPYPAAEALTTHVYAERP